MSQSLQGSSWNPSSINRTVVFSFQLELWCSDQSEWLHSDQLGQCLLDQSNSKHLDSSFAWGQTTQGPGAETSVHLSQPCSGWESTFSLFTKTEDYFSARSQQTGFKILKSSLNLPCYLQLVSIQYCNVWDTPGDSWLSLSTSVVEILKAEQIYRKVTWRKDSKARYMKKDRKKQGSPPRQEERTKKSGLTNVLLERFFKIPERVLQG